MNFELLFTDKSLQSMKRHAIRLDEVYAAFVNKNTRNEVIGLMEASADFREKSVHVLYSLNKNGRCVVINCWAEPVYLN